MHYTEIIKKLLLITPSKGKTPENTTISILIRDPRFIRVEAGTYALKEWYE